MGPASDLVLRRQADRALEASADIPASVALDHQSFALSPRVSSTAGGGLPQQALIDTLRSRIEGIVPRASAGRSPTPALTPDVGERAPACSFSSPPAGWTLGEAGIDRLLPWQGLAIGGLHELKPALATDSPATQLFAMALLARRLQQEEAQGRSLLWAASWRDIAEGGWPYGPGLSQLGLDPARLILVEAKRDSEVLWAIEEGLRSGALAGVLGSLSRLGLTAARRLVLATSAHATPCLLVTPAGTPGAQVALSRWRIGAAPGAAHPLEPALPGRLRFNLTLERCRSREAGRSWIVEWSDASFRFRLAAALADRAARPGLARHRAG